MDKIELIDSYSKAITQGNAGVFLGAGLSVGANFKDWQNLLKEPADSIGLSVEKEKYDLISLAEYILNKKNRTYINELIVNEFENENIIPTENHELLASMPIDVYWTTNYDNLMEKALQNAKKSIAIKRSQTDLAVFKRDQEAVVYKMHGDVSSPENAVLTRTDYELYDTERILFKEALEGQVVTRTFLFLGFSFSDPNLERMLARIRHTLKKSSRTHYCILKNIDPSEEDFSYKQAKLQLQIEDLKNYHIRTVLVDDYNEITDILKKIQKKILLNNILISGSAEDYGDFTNNQANEFISLLTEKLLENNYKVVNGFGIGVGQAVVNGAINYRDKLNLKGVGERLDLRPFPFKNPEKYEDYRKEFINDVGIVLTVFGNKRVDDKIVIADGVMKEAEIANNMEKFLLPIPLTGYAACKIYSKYSLNNSSKINFSALMFKRDRSIEEIVNVIIAELEKIRS